MPLITTRSAVASASICAIRPGHGANCSSIGSVVDTLFVTSLLGGALFAAVIAALDKEPVEVVGAGSRSAADAPEKPGDEAAEGEKR
jgi:hypothetical protein